VASGPAVAALSQIVDTAVRNERGLPDITREIERGAMESLLAMPITPLEIMLGKIALYEWLALLLDRESLSLF
jgi:ABC-type multidrug transport system permease subunit